jgi:DNA-binding SARP family transcriptional activator
MTAPSGRIGERLSLVREDPVVAILSGRRSTLEHDLDPSAWYSMTERPRPVSNPATVPAAIQRWSRLSRFLRLQQKDSAPAVTFTPLAAPDREAPIPLLERPFSAVTCRSQPQSEGESNSCVALLFGSFAFSVNGTLIDAWSGTRGRAVLKYLLAHRDRPVRKETLMETFWPGGDPDSSRNSLNVAVSSLRRTLRPVLGDMPIVVHHQGTYRLNPAIDLSVDIEHFETNAVDGLRRYEAGDAAASDVLADVVRLYRGPLFEDDPFEEWASPMRERLRVLYLDVLDRLGAIAFAAGRYDACVEVDRRILAEDCCREDSHRRLMRCFSRQGRAHQALRQYRSCALSLRVELAVEPSSATKELYEQIREHSPV